MQEVGGSIPPGSTNSLFRLIIRSIECRHPVASSLAGATLQASELRHHAYRKSSLSSVWGLSVD